MNDTTATTVTAFAQLVSAGGGVAFAWLVYRLLDRFLEQQSKRDEAHALQLKTRDEDAAEERAAIFKFMGVLEERSRVDSDERRRERVRTSPFGVPRRRTHSDTQAEEE